MSAARFLVLIKKYDSKWVLAVEPPTLFIYKQGLPKVNERHDRTLEHELVVLHFCLPVEVFSTPLFSLTKPLFLDE